MATLKRLVASTGVTALVSIHQPSLELLLFFDAAVVLGAGGYQAYAGEVGPLGRGLAAYFEGVPPISATPATTTSSSSPTASLGGSRLPRVCPADANPATWVLQQLSEEGGPPTQSSATMEAASTAAIAFGEAWETSEQLRLLTLSQAAALQQPADDIPSNAASPPWHSRIYYCLSSISGATASAPRRSVLVQWAALSARAWRASYRDVLFSGARLLAVVVLAALFGALYFKVRGPGGRG